ncbi:MAG: hypothetical protein ACFBWO_09755 [Paracoccaceae bacterium]
MLSPIFWGSLITLAAGILFATYSAWYGPRYGIQGTMVRLGAALALPLVMLPIVAPIFTLVFYLFTDEAGGAETQAQGLINAMFIELSAGFIAALHAMPYYAVVIVVLALAVLVRHAVTRVAKGDGET